MLKNYFKIAWRNIILQKGYSLINIFGLAVGMACSFLILLWVQHETSFDRFHANADRIYRVIMEESHENGVENHPWMPFPLGRALVERFPEIIAVTRTATDDFMVRYQDKIHSELGFLFVDPSFFSIFSFPFTKGNPAHALDDPASIVISDRMAEKYFGKENPMGKTLALSNRADFAVSGVVHIPAASDFQYDFFISFQSYPRFNADLAALEANWRGNNYPTYIQLGKNCSSAAVENKIAGLMSEFTPDRKVKLHLQKLEHIHLYRPDGTDGQMKNIRIFSIIAVFILLIACINFMNLATARFERRCKEVGVRKTLGSTRSQIGIQFVIESLLSSTIAFWGSLGLVKILLPYFRELAQSGMNPELFHPGWLIKMFVLSLLVGMTAGGYPAIILSRAPAAGAGMRSLFPARNETLRKGLVIFQFSLSAMLIIGTLTIKEQIHFIQEKDMGLDRSDLVYIQMHGDSRRRAEMVKREIMASPDIVNVTSCRYLPSQIFVQWDGLDWEGRPAGKELPVAFSSGDCDFIPTFGMKMVQGRNFSKELPSDENNVIVNEEAVRQMGIKDPIGKSVNFWRQKGTIIGVVKNFNFRPLNDPIKPLLLTLREVGGSRGLLVAKIRPGRLAQALAYFKDAWRKINPNFSFEPHFLDQDFNSLYLKDKQQGRIFMAFTLIAILICCLGLISLSSFMAEEKTKEIGIRKILGASPLRIAGLFIRDFSKWVAIANAIAWPLGYYLMSRWLQGYYYHASINPMIFVLTGGLSAFFASSAVWFQTARAARANPVDSLRYE
ncbi:MAG TPA: ABC transporter permease [Patescibacteria group bacterium]|nr:ABC transporter permease [Patescibacteria group bacterium]